MCSDFRMVDAERSACKEDGGVCYGIRYNVPDRPAGPPCGFCVSAAVSFTSFRISYAARAGTPWTADDVRNVIGAPMWEYVPAADRAHLLGQVADA